MIYMDNASTTKPSAAVVAAILAAAESFGNPSSLHRLGMDAEKTVERSREAIAEKIGVSKKNIFFTSGGTEANNTAVIGKAMSLGKRGRHLITTKIEHPSVLEGFKYLENSGFEVTYINALSDGRIDMEELGNSLREDTVLVSVMHVNNETGVIQPVERIKPLMREKSPVARLHVDAVQSFCKIDIKALEWGIDLLSMSAHKIHGPKGTGALYISDGRINPLIYGGGQQGGIRPGTENVMGIAGFGAAVSESRYNLETARAMRKRFTEMLREKVSDIKVNGSDEFSSGSVLNVSFAGIKAEILLHALEARELYVSTGSACSTHKPQPSHVLTAMGLGKREIEGAIRFSFDENITERDLLSAAEIVSEEAANIRKHM